MIGGEGDPHRAASFQSTQPDRADLDKLQKPSDIAFSTSPNTFFSSDLFGIPAWSAVTKVMRDGDDWGRVIVLIRKGRCWRWIRHDRDRVSSDQGLLVGDRGAISQIRDN